MLENQKINLLGLNREELVTQLLLMGEKPFRVNQLWHWIYHRGVKDFHNMSSLPKSLQKKFSSYYTINRPIISCEQSSQDQTKKWLIKTHDNLEYETVFIPEQRRGALCLSSQVGCTLNCSFCHTGTQRLVRNLTPGEIVGQFMVAKDEYNDWSNPGAQRKLSNIVMMGMGEPLYNFASVEKALKIFMDPEGIALSKRRITLSTSGVVPVIKKVGEKLGVGLAISLHAVTNELRNELVPINRKYPIEELLLACKTYPSASSARRITFEYVMLDGINDSSSDAKELSRLLKNIHAKVNLIPFNTWPGSSYKPSPRHKIERFSRVLNENKISAPIRVPRGRDILAACGQLKSQSSKIVSRDVK